jgi:pimeloyl-ACP methyl ester carboxylesterase
MPLTVLLGALALGACGGPANLMADRLNACEIGEGPRGSYCGALTVYENRAAQVGRTIDLKIVVAPALRRDPKPDPLFVLIGGPGGGAATMAETLLPGFRRFQTDRDIAFVDQRGTGASNPLDCDPAEQTFEALVEYPVERLRRCLERLDADPRFYATSLAMDDLEDVRRYLGYGEINLWGASYGTTAALDYLARHEASVRSVILDSVAPPGASFPLYVPRDGQRALERLIADCGQEPACGSRFPDLATTVETVLNRAAERPTIRILHPRTGVPLEGMISRELVAGTILGALYSPTIASLLPQLLTDAEQGSYQGLLGMRFFDGPPPNGTGEGAFLSVHCSEGAARLTREELVREARGSFLGTVVFDTAFKPCEFWPRGTIDPAFFDSVESAKPVLVLSGAEDPVTPPVWGERAAATLANARHIVVPATGHLVSPRGCVPLLMAEFLNTVDADALDATCLDSLRRPPFFTDRTRGENP